MLDYNNIKFPQFVDFLPKLDVSSQVDLDELELLFSTFPVWDIVDEEDEVVKHIISVYEDKRDGTLVIHPVGTICFGEHPGIGILFEEFELSAEALCLVTGRLSLDGWISFSSVQGCLGWDETHNFMPYDIQSGGEAVFKQLFFDRKFFRAYVRDRYCRTTVSGAQEDALKPIEPFF